MRTALVIVLSPGFELSLGVPDGQKPVGAQALLAEAAVERLDGGVIRGLFWPGEVKAHPVGIGPGVQGAGDKLGPIVTANLLLQAAFLDNPLQCRDHILALDALFSLEGQALGVKMSRTLSTRSLRGVAPVKLFLIAVTKALKSLFIYWVLVKDLISLARLFTKGFLCDGMLAQQARIDPVLQMWQASAELFF